MSAGVVRVQSGPRRLDEGRLYRVWNGLPVQPEGFNKAGDPMDAKGKIMPQRTSVKYFLQDGLIFDLAGELVEKPPKPVVEWAEKMKEEGAFPGITASGRVITCPASGCSFRTTVERFYLGHRLQHKDISDERWAELEGKAGVKRAPFSLSDFVDPKDGMRAMGESLLGVGAPMRESPQGEG